MTRWEDRAIPNGAGGCVRTTQRHAMAAEQPWHLLGSGRWHRMQCLAYDVMTGWGVGDGACAARPVLRWLRSSRGVGLPEEDGTARTALHTMQWLGGRGERVAMTSVGAGKQAITLSEGRGLGA